MLCESKIMFVPGDLVRIDPSLLHAGFYIQDTNFQIEPEHILMFVGETNLHSPKAIKYPGFKFYDFLVEGTIQSLTQVACSSLCLVSST